MVVLCTMDCGSESKEYCTIFFEKINEMLEKYATENNENGEGVEFRPFHLKDDEHGGNKIGMANVLGKSDLLFYSAIHSSFSPDNSSAGALLSLTYVVYQYLKSLQPNFQSFLSNMVKSCLA